MARDIQSAMTWLAGKFTERESQTVTYRRGIASLSISATEGRVENLQVDDSGFVTQYRVQDWLIKPADIASFGNPQKGDRIIATVGGQERTFEVLDLSGEQHFQRVDHGSRLRIHTKDIG